MNRIIHFELNSPNADKSQEYFGDLFGWTFNKWEGPMDYRLCCTGKDEPGINGAIMPSQDGEPRTVTVVGVDDLDAATKQAADLGGTVVVDKMAIEGVGYVSYVVDPRRHPLRHLARRRKREIKSTSCDTSSHSSRHSSRQPPLAPNNCP